MSKDKLSRARSLMDEGRYREARRALRGVKDPAAAEILAEIDEQDDTPPRSSNSLLRDFLHVLLIGMIFAALFGGVGYLLATQRGLKLGPPGTSVASADRPNSGTVGTPIPQPTATPTLTPIPCEAQAWWDANGAAMNQVVNDVLNLSVEMRPADIQRARTSFQAWQAGIDSAPVAPCLAPVQTAALDAAQAMDDLYAAHLTTTTEQERAQKRLTTMDKLLPVADAAAGLNINLGDGAAWVQTVQNFTRGDCPAERWFIETMVIRDYQRFFRLVEDVSIQNQSLAETQNTLREMRNLQSAFETDSAAFPECIKPASDHYLNGMKEFINTINTLLNGDRSASDAHLQAARAQINEFFAEIATLSPNLAGAFRQTGF
ncbi:MAG: hypothetical protein HZC41_24195 [Chloroflexi bacterium]|nr:hypothetical protein [Chloroflexota bacterium]